MISKNSKKLSKKTKVSKGKVLVAMSGGVDSSVAAYLLQKEGYEVEGATIRVWIERGGTKEGVEVSIKDARAVCKKLKIPHHVFDFQRDFKKEVVSYFTDEYLKGRTPNPCVFCNRAMKFGKFLKRAEKMGFDYVATGHYAQIVERGDCCYAAEGSDKAKDQSYVLSLLGQDALSKTLLPVGGKTKRSIRATASRAGLKVADKKESMEICFIPSNDYGKFLLKQNKIKPKPGSIYLKSGQKVGTHQGYFNYTIGQRRGLGVAYTESLYVLALDPKRNRVIVGTKKDVLGKKFLVKDINWAGPIKSGATLKLNAKIRARTPKAPAKVVISKNKKSAEATFEKPHEAITPGQAAVFYDGDIVVGGGWIDKVFPFEGNKR